MQSSSDVTLIVGDEISCRADAGARISVTRNSTIDEVYRQYLEQNRLLERVLVHVDRANQRVTPLIKTSSTVADYGLISTSELIAVFNQPARAWREKKGQKTLRQVPLEQRESSSASFNRVFQDGLTGQERVAWFGGQFRYWDDSFGRFAELSLIGPTGTPYEGGHFRLLVDWGLNYPFDMMGIWFITKIFHPLVDDSGAVHLGAIDWSPAWGLKSVILVLLAQLTCPGFVFGDTVGNVPANVCHRPDWAALTEGQAHAKAREWTRQYARPIPWSPIPAIHQAFPSEFRQTVLCLFMLARRTSPLADSGNKRRRLVPSLSNGFARLPRCLIVEIVRMLAPLHYPALWHLNRHQILCLRATDTATATA